MRITEKDIESRKRMARLKDAVSDALYSQPLGDLTHAEVIIVFAELALRWAQILRREDLAAEESPSE